MSELPSPVVPAASSRPVALITGCSSGIGQALAQALLTQGYLVYASARSSDALVTLQQTGCRVVQLDVNDETQISQVLAQISSEQHRLDLLINNAGYGAIGPLFDLSADELRQQFQTNVFALVELTRQALPLLAKSQGTVVNIGSVSASLVTPFAGAYCASKAAVHALSQAMQMELAPFGIRVLLAITGAIDTGFANKASQYAAQLSAHSWWAPYRAGVHKRANASQTRPTSAAVYAQQLIAAIDNPTVRQVRLGSGSRLLPLLSLLPRRWLQQILQRKFMI